MGTGTHFFAGRKRSPSDGMGPTGTDMARGRSRRLLLFCVSVLDNDGGEGGWEWQNGEAVVEAGTVVTGGCLFRVAVFEDGGGGEGLVSEAVVEAWTVGTGG